MPPGQLQDYDPDTESKRGFPKSNLGPGHDRAAGDASDPRDIRNNEEGLYTPEDDEADDSGGTAGGSSGSSKRDKDKDGRTKRGSANRGGANDPDGETGRFGRGRAKLMQARAKMDGVRQRARKKKLLIGGVLGGSGVVVVIVLALILLAGIYKAVDFAEHVAAYNFARVTRQMSESTDRITAEQIGRQLIGDENYSQVEASLTKGSAKLNDLWSKFDKYSPNKTIANFESSDKLKFNYRNGKFGQKVLDSVTIGGQEVNIVRGSAKNLIPGYKFVGNVKFSNGFVSDLNSALKANDIGPITRAKISAEIRQRLGIGLVAWTVGKYAGKSDSDARIQAQKDALAAAEGNDTTVAPSLSSQVTQTAQEASDAERAALNTPAGEEEAIEHPNQLPTAAQKIIDAAITQGGLLGVQGAIRTLLNVINPIYAFAAPLCLIYDGSLTKSGGTIDKQSEQAERTGIHVQTASAELKEGSQASAEAAGAEAWKLGDITKSNAEMRASGLHVDTSAYGSTQASATGQYSLASFLPGPLDSAMTHIASVCPAITNVWVGVGLGAANVGVALFTGGAPLAGDAATAATAETALETTVPPVSRSMIGRLINAGATTKEFALSTGKSVVLIGGLTLLAKALVVAHMGDSHNSLATGKSYADTADDGTNQYANQVNNQQFYGAPMQDSQLTSDNAANNKQLATLEGQKSAFDRYLAVTNPDSLLSKAAITTSGYVNGSLPSSIFRLGSSLLNPVRAFGTILGSLFTGTSFAAQPVTSANTYYGNVQFGYTSEEQYLIDHDDDYAPFKNQQVLDASGNEDAINDKYGKCFDGSMTIGTMLSDGYIKRNAQGDVLADDSLCSPKSLGLANDTYGPNMVFRWRLANNYNNTLDQLISEQDVDQ